MVLKKVRKWTKVWILLFLNYLNRLLSYEFDRHPCIRKPACKAQIINNIKLMEICYTRTQVCHFHKPYTVAMFHFHAQQASRNPKTIHERIIRLSNNQLERSFHFKNFDVPKPLSVKRNVAIWMPHRIRISYRRTSAPLLWRVNGSKTRHFSRDLALNWNGSISVTAFHSLQSQFREHSCIQFKKSLYYRETLEAHWTSWAKEWDDRMSACRYMRWRG
jgi:hypothetical protein